MVELTPSSEVLHSLTLEDRIKAINRIILAARTRYVLAKTKEDEAFELPSAESVVTRYLSSGFLEKHTGPYYSNLALFLLSNNTALNFPIDLLKASGEITPRQLEEALDPSSAQLYETVLTFLRESVQWEWMEKEVAVKGLTNAMLNYRVTKKQFMRCSTYLASQLA